MSRADELAVKRAHALIREMWMSLPAGENARLWVDFRTGPETDLLAIKDWVVFEILGLGPIYRSHDAPCEIDPELYARLVREVPGVIAFVAKKKKERDDARS